jgi:hypothetical protein
LRSTAVALGIHPAVFVTAGFFCLLGIQAVRGSTLDWGAAAMLIFALAFANEKLRLVIRRLKYIMLAVTVLFAWQTPGILVVPALEAFSPTYDGFRAAIEPLMRLFATAAVVAVMLSRFSANQWVNSLYVLVSPLKNFGVSPDRFAVRLRLVLDHLEREELDWRRCLDDDHPYLGSGDHCAWSVSTLNKRDRFVLTGMLFLFAGGWILI